MGDPAMKIALVADHLIPMPPAAGRCPGDPAAGLLPLADALAGHGHQVTVCSHGDTGACPASPRAGVTLEHIPAGPRGRLSDTAVLTHIADFAAHLAQRWRHSAPDVAHAHFWTSGVAALAAVRGLDIPVAVTFHSLAAVTRPPSAGVAVRARMESAIARSVGAVLADTSDERRDVGRLGRPQAAVRVVPPGVDLTRFRPSGPTADRGPRARLLTVWVPGDPQGLAATVRALAEVPDAELVIAGAPARAVLARNPEYRAVTQLAGQLGVQDRLVWTGELAEAGLAPLMRSADVLVHLSPDQALAMVPAQAMACGTPVIASVACGAHRDAVIHETTGFLVAPADPAALPRRIRQLLGSPVRLEGYGIAAANRARSRYAWERIAEETLAVYEELARPGVPAAA
jgi:glycosyltransferase involved in cell wall biosynthesis